MSAEPKPKPEAAPAAEPLGFSPLDDPSWRHVDKTSLEDFRAPDWERLNRQRTPYYAEHQAEHALRLLQSQRGDPSFGYQVNNYGHSLQSATLAWQDGADEETVVVALMHDIGFVACPTTHAEFAVALLGPYVSERNTWMLRRHAAFQALHCHEYPGSDPDQRERWRGHPHFEYAADWVRKYDIPSIDAGLATMPIAAFEPMVRRVFARPPRGNPFPLD